MCNTTELLSYLAHVTGMGELCEVSLDASPSWTVPVEEIRSGGLTTHMTREMLLAYSTIHPYVPFGSTTIPVVCCIRSLVDEKDGRRRALLCLGATIDPNGTILPQQEFSPWIPQSALYNCDLQNEEFVVCDLDAYRAHAVALGELPRDDAWGTAISSAEDLFDSVSTITDDRLAQVGARLDDKTCIILFWERPTTELCASKIFEELRDAKSLDAHSPIYRLLSDNDEPAWQDDEDERQLPDDVLLAPKLTCGMFDHLRPMGSDEHDALAALARQDHGDILAVSAPANTNGPTLTLNALANFLTGAALRGDEAPFMCCVGSVEQLITLVKLLERRPTVSQVALGSRWLPRIAESRGVTGDTAAGRRTLGALPALFVFHACDGLPSLESPLCLTNPYGHELCGDLAQYRDPWYVPKATTYYLDCVSSFLRQRTHSATQARSLLSELLRHIDQDRCELIDAYANVCNAAELLKRRDGLVRRIGRLRRGHTVCRERLEFWRGLQNDYKPRLTLMAGDQDQSKVILDNAQKGETLAQGKTKISEVCDAYDSEILRIETSIDRLRGAAANLNTRIRAAAPEGVRCTHIIGRLTDLCHLTTAQRSELESTLDGRVGDVSMTRLQSVLDTTVRPVEFWLAVHIFESHWLSFARQNVKSMRQGSEDMGTLWNNVASICPISLVPTNSAVGTLSRIVDARDKRCDLVVALDAGSSDAWRGITLAQLSQQMMAMGSVTTMGGRPIQASTFDELQCTQLFGQHMWERIKAQGLAASDGHTFYEYAVSRGEVERVALRYTLTTYGELDDLRCDLFPQERLSTLRAPANSADDKSYPLRGIIPSLSYVLVPDSSWQQAGASRSNRAEAMALKRWLINHATEILSRYHNTKEPLAILCPFAAQARVVSQVLNGSANAYGDKVRVLHMSEVHNRTWPVVVLCATCGPDAFDNLGPNVTAKHILGVATAAATDAFVMFCGGVWTRSSNDTASRFFMHATRVGRLFSSPRTAKPSTSTSTSPSVTSNNSTVNVHLRSKPLSISSLARLLEDRGDIDAAPPATNINRALADVGLIERVRLDGNKKGWRPTAAGREVGIVAVRDRSGNPFCAYPPSTEAVVATVIQSMDE